MNNSNPSPREPPRPPSLDRVADYIRGQVLRRTQNDTESMGYLFDELLHRCTQLNSLRRRLVLCQDRGFLFARCRILQELEILLQSLPAELQQLRQYLPPPDHPVLGVAEIARELLQLEEEFGGWSIDPVAWVLTVTTDTIELEGVDLGPFEIQLHLQQLGNRRATPYQVVALEPNCPAANHAVTHPHVSDRQLCEGEASAAIHAALAEGRLCDFFMLVRSVLTTHNRSSPYVPLDEWSGIPCHDCGYVCRDDERSTCEACERDFCGECISSCSTCDKRCCAGCLETCSACGKSTCNACMSACRACDQPCCEQCLEDGRCQECREPPLEDDNDAHTEASPDPQQHTGEPAAPAAST